MTLYVSLVRPKLEYASCVWWPFYDMHVNRTERVQRKFVRYALRELGSSDMYYDIPPYVDVCTLIHWLGDVLTRTWCFFFRRLTGRVSLQNLLALINLSAPHYHIGGDFLRIDFHRTNYDVYEPFNNAVRPINEVADLFYFYSSSNLFLIVWGQCCNLVRLFTLCWITLYTFPWPFLRATSFSVHRFTYASSYLFSH
jgi:hypothetical protein